MAKHLEELLAKRMEGNLHRRGKFLLKSQRKILKKFLEKFLLKKMPARMSRICSCLGPHNWGRVLPVFYYVVSSFPIPQKSMFFLSFIIVSLWNYTTPKFMAFAFFEKKKNTVLKNPSRTYFFLMQCCHICCFSILKF